MGVAYTTLEKGGYIHVWILRKTHVHTNVCACIWREEIYDSEKRGYGWVQLGWTVCNQARGVRCYLPLYKRWEASQNQHVHLYVAQSNDKKLSGFFYSNYSCSIHLISLIHLLMTHWILTYDWYILLKYFQHLFRRNNLDLIRLCIILTMTCV